MKAAIVFLVVILAGFSFALIITYIRSLLRKKKMEDLASRVNNNIKFQDPSVPGSLSHSLEQAVASGRGVCRDKSTALEYGLRAVGISAARVVSNGHEFVAVLNPDGSANHYLDPMYYETYLPLQRLGVNRNQIIPPISRCSPGGSCAGVK